ncbi:hypothetical protein [Cupriavidus sp. DF5525]|uniref:hypothetical protein n=1 Tax=Cupriavidus sp. DF5525 TaxID=3160989 RepID=UPI0032DEDC12
MKDEKMPLYRGYQLVARATSTGAQCWAWYGGKPVHKVLSDTIDGAIAAAKQAIDAALGPAEISGEVGFAAYKRAFETILPGLTTAQIRMLQAHFYAPDQTLTATQLADAAGYSSYSAANIQYGNVGKALFEQHPVALPTRNDGSLIYTFALADDGGSVRSAASAGSAEDEAHWRWKLLPAVAHALKALGVVKG